MADETKYGKYFITEPIEQGPMLHICGDDDCYGLQFPSFPVEVQLLCLSQPGTMIEKPHTHEVDELFFIFGGNPKNYFEFGAEIEIWVGEGDDQECHIVDKTTIVYFPAGVAHCPIVTRKVDKPVQWMHVLFQGKYQMTDGDDMSKHPGHDIRFPYKPEEILKLRQGITEGIIKPLGSK
ncbi:hypothetical protein ACFL1N_04540 [Thermodesulfobacteriota bacterium]